MITAPCHCASSEPGGIARSARVGVCVGGHARKKYRLVLALVAAFLFPRRPNFTDVLVLFVYSHERADEPFWQRPKRVRVAEQLKHRHSA